MKNIGSMLRKLVENIDNTEMIGGGDMVQLSFNDLYLDVRVHAHVLSGEPRNIYLENTDVLPFMGDTCEWREFRKALRKHIHEEIDAMMKDV